MNRFIHFFNNNSILFFSWFCVPICFIIGEEILKTFLPLYLKHIIYCYYLLIPFIIFSIFYSFYQSIKSMYINKVYAFVLLIFYLVAWGFFTYDFFDYGINEISIIKFSIFILINVCFCLYNLFKKKDITLIIYLMFYGSNSFLLYFLIKHIK